MALGLEGEPFSPCRIGDSGVRRNWAPARFRSGELRRKADVLQVGCTVEQSLPPGDVTDRNAAEDVRVHALHRRGGSPHRLRRVRLASQFFYAKRNGRVILGEFKKRQTVETQKSYLEEDPDRLENLLNVLNVFEALSTEIQMGYADDQTAKRFFRSILLEYWHTTESFVKSRRTERQNPRILQEMEWLFNEWKD